MKKLLSIVLLLALVSLPLTASAAGKLTVTNETFIVLPYSDYHAGHIFAELENTGDKPVQFSGSLLELYNADGESVESTTPYRSFPNVLEPGEKGFLYAYQSVKEATDRSYIDDYSLTVTGKGGVDIDVVRFPATARYEQDTSGYWAYNYVIADVTNDTDEIAYDVNAVFAARDAEGTLLHVEYASLPYVGIPPSSTIAIRATIDRDVIEYYEEKGTPVSSVDVIVFTEKRA